MYFSLQNEIAKLNYEENAFENLIGEERKLTNEMERIRDNLDSFFGRYKYMKLY